MSALNLGTPTRRSFASVLLLCFLALLFAAFGEWLGLPASFLLGPMLASILFASFGRTVAVPRLAIAQSVIGCMMARYLPVDIFRELGHEWVLSIASIVSVVAAATCVGLMLARFRILPGTTAIWGAMPGAAAAMVLMAAEYGADEQLVAFMQYLRVLMVAAAASSVVAIVGSHLGGSASGAWFPPLHAGPLAGTLLLAVASAVIGPRLPISVGALVMPLALGAVLQDAGVLRIELPPVVLCASYALLGLSFGGRFTPDILRHTLRALPGLALATTFLILVCAALAVVIAHEAHVGFLTAYLATSPGGADTVAIIAAGADVNAPFVMALQAARFFLILILGPIFARFLAERWKFSAIHRSDYSPDP